MDNPQIHNHSELIKTDLDHIKSIILDISSHRYEVMSDGDAAFLNRKLAQMGAAMNKAKSRLSEPSQ